jgi:hypothetical protein
MFSGANHSNDIPALCSQGHRVLLFWVLESSAFHKDRISFHCGASASAHSFVLSQQIAVMVFQACYGERKVNYNGVSYKEFLLCPVKWRIVDWIEALPMYRSHGVHSPGPQMVLLVGLGAKVKMKHLPARFLLLLLALY